MNGLTKCLIAVLLLFSLSLTVISCGPKGDATDDAQNGGNGGEAVSDAASETEEEGSGLSGQDNLDTPDYGPFVRV